jgi:hypothetical protein
MPISRVRCDTTSERMAYSADAAEAEQHADEQSGSHDERLEKVPVALEHLIERDPASRGPHGVGRPGQLMDSRRDDRGISAHPDAPVAPG